MCKVAAKVKKLFSLVKSGNKAQLLKLMSRKYGNVRDKAGRTLLHSALQYLQKDETKKNK